jgi:hypothetical protein
MFKALIISTSMVVGLAVVAASASSYQNFASFGSGSLEVDPEITTATFTQNAEGITFGPSVQLGNTLNAELISPVRLPAGAVDLAVVMRVTGSPSELPFSVEIFGSAPDFTSLARFQGTTAGVGEVPVIVPLKLFEGSALDSAIGGVAFTWDGDGSTSTQILHLAVKQAEGGGGGGGGSEDLAPPGITSVKLLPPKRTVKAGKKTRFFVVVSNNSTQSQEVEVDFTSSDTGVLMEPDSVEILVPGKKTEAQRAKTKRFKVVIETDEYDEGTAELTASIGSNVKSAPCRVTIKPKKFKD